MVSLLYFHFNNNRQGKYLGKILVKKSFFHIIFAIIFASLVILPDIIFHFMYPTIIHHYFPLKINLDEFFYIFLFSLLVISIKSLLIRCLFFYLFMSFALFELAYFSYFGTVISPYVILLFFTQTKDIIESFMNLITYVYPSFILIALLSVPVTIALFKLEDKIEGKKFKFKYAWVLVFLVFIIFSVAAFFKKDLEPFQPAYGAYSVKNFFLSSALLVGKELPRGFGIVDEAEKKDFFDYEVKPIEDTNKKPNQNIVLIMGESLGYPRMSLFGYPIKTTPNLERMGRNNEIIFKKALAGGVQTDVSVPSFLTLKREPQNTKPLHVKDSNLFDLAKKANFKVHYISVQNSGYLGEEIGRNADIVMFDKDFALKYPNKQIFDDVLIEYLKNIDLSVSNFIVLHQRSSHFPYENYTPEKFKKFEFNRADFRDYNLKTYANALLFTDHIIFSAIEHLKNSPIPVAFFATSDHGEMMGENGMYGHSLLYLDAAKVPFIFWHQGFENINKELISKITSVEDGISHYEIGKLIANSIGFEIINQNENGEFFVNGVDINGRGGFISYKKSDLKGKL